MKKRAKKRAAPAKKKTKVVPETLPAWNLSDLFSGVQDPKIAEVTAFANKLADAFVAKYRGRLTQEVTTAEELLALLKGYEEIFLHGTKPLEYAHLLFAESCVPSERGAFQQRVRTEFLALRSKVVFVELELLSHPMLERLRADPVLVDYQNYLTKLVQSKPHRLSEREEQLLEQCALTGRMAWTRLFDEELALKKFTVKLPQGKKVVTQVMRETEVLDLLYHPTRTVRKEAARALTAGLEEESRRLTYITNTLAQDKAIEDSLRQFATPEASRHLANEITQPMVTVMSDTVVKNYPVVQRYYRFKAKVLKLSTLADYDRYAPVGGAVPNIPFAKAREYVLGAFYSFSQEYGAIAEQFFAKNWIDAEAREGKRGGAFCSYTTPDVHPYVFVNYTGSVREVFTLAHELGHAIHGYQMRERGVLNADTPLTIAETASVFAEMLLFKHLKAELRDQRALRSLTMVKVESIFATVFRQISMYLFERDVHYARRSSGELTTAQINYMWRAQQTKMFGNAVKLGDHYDLWWSYIPHFLHSPFYVYAYAFGELLTLALYAQYERAPEGFAERYLAMLAAGGSLAPQDLLAPFDINLNGAEFWQGGIDVIDYLVSTAISLKSGK